MVLVKGDEARLTFARDASPRLAGLTAALDAVQFEAEVRRAAPLSLRLRRLGGEPIGSGLVRALTAVLRSEEHTSELQSHSDLVCRLLLEKKNERESQARHPIHRRA